MMLIAQVVARDCTGKHERDQGDEDLSTRRLGEGTNQYRPPSAAAAAPATVLSRDVV
jgi:hypothetical protein